MNQYANDELIFETLNSEIVFAEATGPDANIDFKLQFLPMMQKARRMQAAGMDAAETFEIMGRLWTAQAMRYGELVGVLEEFHVINGSEEAQQELSKIEQLGLDVMLLENERKAS